MVTTLHLNYGAPIPVGHVVEITEFEDARPERKRGRGNALGEPHTAPMVVDVTTGIRYMHHAHASSAGNGGNAFTPNAYPLEPRADLVVREVRRGTVTACSVVFVEALTTQHTTLRIEG